MAPVPTRADQAADIGRLIALAALALGVILVLNLVEVVNSAAWGIPLVLGGVGVAVLWRQADDAQRARLREAAGRQASAGGRIGWGRTLFGVALVIAGLIAFLLAQEGISGGGQRSARGHRGLELASRWSPARGCSGWGASCPRSASSACGRRSGPRSRRTCTTRCCRR